MFLRILFGACISLSAAWISVATVDAADPIRVVFLGDRGHHRPADFAGRLVPAMNPRDIQIDYTEDLGMLSKERLQAYDVLLVYANIDTISKEQESALLEFVASGKGFVPLHCATYCFRNSDAYIALCGAQFKSHGGEEFETVIVASEHPVMKDFSGFRSWDETYVHTKHNVQDRTVLEVRRQGGQAKGNTEEPWTWVRTHGKGRVFYTAWGHDVRTWEQPGFLNLLERGIRWSAGRDPSVAEAFASVEQIPTGEFPIPKIKPARSDVQPFTYFEVGANIPNYRPNAKRGTQGAPLTTMQAPLPAEESIKHYVTPEGFAPSLWASEPQLAGKPIAMNWDDRGRLWVCETVDYPNELQPKGSGRDRIRICEDNDGDGRADRFTVFAEKLSIPTAIEFYRGGALVQDGQTTVYLKDIDGDDRADLRQELVTGWALGDTHGGVSNFHYGADNWFWAMQGYNDSHPVINGQAQQGFRMGFWRFRVEAGAADATAPVASISNSKADASKFASHTIRVRELEFIRATSNNTWGLGMSEEGLIFGSTANGNPSNFMPIPNRYYERVKGWSPTTLKMISDTYMFSAPTDKIRQVDWHGGYTAGAGHALYTSRMYPKSWWNRLAFVCEPTAHLVGAFDLQRKGGDYASYSPFNLVASDDEWAAPIMAEVGPDGMMWILDWYNYIVQHNPTPQGFTTGKGNAYESELRDKKHGRVYRVVYEGTTEQFSDEATQASLATKKSRGLAVAENAALVQALHHPTMRWRLIAQRLLVERNAIDAQTVDSLLQMVSLQQTDALGLSPSAMHALWTLQGLGLVTESRPDVLSVVAKALKSPLPGVRRAAIQVLPATETSGTWIVDAELLEDEDYQVRLAALLQLSNLPATVAGPWVGKLCQLSPTTIDDPWLMDAWTSAAATHAEAVLPTLLGSSQPWPKLLAERIAIVASHVARSRPVPSQIARLIEAFGHANTDNVFIVLQGLERGWPDDYRLNVDETTAKSIANSMEKLPIQGKSLLVQLAASWGATALENQVKLIDGELAKAAMNEKLDAKDRVHAARLMVVMQPTQTHVVDRLVDAISPQLPPDVAAGFLEALTHTKSDRVAPAILAKIGTFTPDTKANAIRLLLARTETTISTVEAIRDGKLTISDLQLDQQQTLRDNPNRRVRDLFESVMRSGGQVLQSDRAKLVEDWSGLCEEKGDASRGKELFTKHCSICHQHTGVGQNIGPDLTGMSVHPKHELLIHILDPNRSVEGNFRTYSVLTVDGIAMSGMLAGESRTSVELVDTQGKRQSIQRDDIERFTASRKSLMPEGFESQINQTGMKDLLEFLTTKGRFVPISLARAATVVSTKPLFSDRDNGADQLIFDDWKPKTFFDVPFTLIDPQGRTIPNIVMLYGPRGPLPPKMPKSVTIPCSVAAKALHLLSGVSGWGYPASRDQSVSMIVRLQYEDGVVEEHPLLNGVHFADYIRRVDVPGSKFAASLRNQQLRFLTITPKREVALKEMTLVKGPDDSAPIVMAITVETFAK